ncbi:hypothetical protein [Caballeronia catudaia]|uniref:hypothetical protein n=1 Tax=Caballeronia catudaia TaxID=1777136 RepID=UPI00117FF2A9|nr:hypothetical protein [Caballeronia catudaia]
MLTRGAETAVRAVVAARGVTRRFHDYGEADRVEKKLSHIEGREPRLSAPATAHALEQPQRTSNSMLATVAMAGVVLGACVLARAYFENHGSTARAAAVPVAVAGPVSEAAPKIGVAARTVEGRAPDAARPPADTASPLIPVVASSKESTPQAAVHERPAAKKNVAPRTQASHKVAPKAAPKAAATCSQKSDRACAKSSQRQASKTEPKPQQTSKPQARRQEVAKGKSGTKDFQKVAAIPAPVKPAMTADGSWKPSRKN